MDTSLLSEILAALKTVASLAGVISGGVILTYFILPHIAGHIQASFITLVWVTFLLGLYIFYVGPQIMEPTALLIEKGFSIIVYRAIPYEYAENLWNTLLIMVSVYVVKLALFPHAHHPRK